MTHNPRPPNDAWTCMTATYLTTLQHRTARERPSLCLPAVSRLSVTFLAILLALCFAAGPVAAQEPLKGVALVIGQSEYAHLAKLDNPGNDAKRVDELLTGLGFKTDVVDNRSAKRCARP